MTADRPSSPAPAEAMVSLIQTTIGTVLGPLVGQLDTQCRTLERLAEAICSKYAALLGR